MAKVALFRMMLGLLLLHGLAAVAAEDPPKPEIHWIDSYGKIVPLGWRTMGQWELNPGGGKRPVFRTWVEVPPELRVQAVSGAGIAYRSDVRESPLTSPRGTVVAIDTVLPMATATLRLAGAKGAIQEISLLIRFSMSKPWLRINGSCDDIGVTASPSQQGEAFLYASIRCKDEGETVAVLVEYSGDARLTATDLTKLAEPSPGQTVLRVRKPTLDQPRAVVVGTYSLAPHTAWTSPTAFQVYLLPRSNKRWITSLNVGGTYIDYRESIGGVHLTEIGVTGKANVGYKLIFNRLDVATNAFVTMVPFRLTGKPSSIPPARFYGINGRLSFEFPRVFVGHLWHAMAGWYFWGMLVPGQAYGIRSLSGPQVFILLRSPRAGAGSYAAYVKYAPITDSLRALTFKNAEAAIGGSYVLGMSWGKKVWSLTLDLSRAQFESPEQGNGMRLITGSLGVQVGL